MSESFDLVVVGGGPAGVEAALQGARLGRRVALVDDGPRIGGAVAAATVPSKALHDAARRRAHGGGGDPLDLSWLPRLVEDHARAAAAHLARAGVVNVRGRARFVDPTTLAVGDRLLQARGVVLATGARPRRPRLAPTHPRVLDSDQVGALARLPRELVVIGGGVIAWEWASILAGLGVQVTLVDPSPRPLDAQEPALVDVVRARFERDGGRLLLGDPPAAIDARDDGVTTRLRSGEVVRADSVLVSAGRATDLGPLDLARAGLGPDAHGRLSVDACGRTAVAHVTAAGDVIGPPGLAGTALEQGRRAALAALSLDPGPPLAAPPVGIFTLPELASAGEDAVRARARGLEVVVGHADLGLLARGRIGDTGGRLQLVVARDRRVLGVQLVGDGATELVHVGLLALGRPVGELVSTPFNFPTLAEGYRVAALDALDQLARERTAAA